MRASVSTAKGMRNAIGVGVLAAMCLLTGCGDADQPADAGTGPLTLIETDSSMEALTYGMIEITDECVWLVNGPSRSALIWPSDRTTWDPKGQIVFTTGDGTTTTLTDGDEVRLSGGGSSRHSELLPDGCRGEGSVWIVGAEATLVDE